MIMTILAIGDYFPVQKYCKICVFFVNVYEKNYGYLCAQFRLFITKYLI